MKKMFNVIVITLAFIIAALFYYLVMGNGANFVDPVTKLEPIPGNVLGTVYTGGFLVFILLGLIIISVTFIFERTFSIKKAAGKGNQEVFMSNVIKHLESGNLNEALTECESQRGSMANILRAAITRFQDVEKDSNYPGEKKIAEVQRAIDESMNLETPLLEKNLVMLSTVASISTMVGLLGTTLGMIRSFQALAASGTVSAIQLSLGISEALYNTAGGLIGAILSIVAYNFFTTKVDNFVYMIDEAILNVSQIFTIKIKN